MWTRERRFFSQHVDAFCRWMPACRTCPSLPDSEPCSIMQRQRPHPTSPVPLQSEPARSQGRQIFALWQISLWKNWAILCSCSVKSLLNQFCGRPLKRWDRERERERVRRKRASFCRNSLQSKEEFTTGDENEKWTSSQEDQTPILLGSLQTVNVAYYAP